MSDFDAAAFSADFDVENLIVVCDRIMSADASGGEGFFTASGGDG